MADEMMLWCVRRPRDGAVAAVWVRSGFWYLLELSAYQVKRITTDAELFEAWRRLAEVGLDRVRDDEMAKAAAN